MGMVNNAELLEQSRARVQGTKGYQRITALFDEGTFHEVDCFVKSGEDYAEAVAGYGEILGSPAYAFAQNSDLAGGAMSRAQAEKIKKVQDLAAKTGAPVIGIYDSIGGRLGEGEDLLAAYGELLLANNNLSGVVPQISLVLGPCIGTSALIAASADLVVLSDKAELTVDVGGQGGSADAAVQMGLCHVKAENENAAMDAVRRLVSVLPSNNITGTPAVDDVGASGASSLTQEASPEMLLSSVSDDGSFLELCAGFGKACLAGLSQMAGTTVGLVCYQGELDADSCSKAARFVRFCDAFSIPVVSFVDATEFSTLREAVKLSHAYSEATTAKVTVITGQAYGPVYIALAGRGANADSTLAWTSASVSAMSPAAAALFLQGDKLKGSSNPIADREKLIEEYRQTQASPFQAAAGGFVDDIILPEETRARILANLEMLEGKRVTRLPKKHSNIQI